MKKRLLACLIAGLVVSSFAGVARAATMYLPQAVKDATVVNGENMLGVPDGDYTLFDNGSTATYYQFDYSFTYNAANLASFLNVSENTILNSEFIAFDHNGSPSGFETSSWVFSDGVNTVSVSHSTGDSASGVISVNSYMSLTDFNTVFGSSFPSSSAQYVGFLLFDLTSANINISSSDFEVQLTGGVGDPRYYAPDLIGLAALSTAAVPEPATLLLFGTGLVGLAGLRIRRARK